MEAAMAATKNDPATTAPPSDAWRPEVPGEQLHGVVTDIDTAWSKFRAQKAPNDPDAGFYPLLTIQDAAGIEHKVHAFRTVLYNEVLRKQPIVGETVAITFVGIGAERDGMNGAHIYRVKVEGRTGGPDPYKGLRPASGPGGAAIEAGSDVPTDTADDDDIPY